MEQGSLENKVNPEVNEILRRNCALKALTPDNPVAYVFQR
jgi:hypothetical protein